MILEMQGMQQVLELYEMQGVQNVQEEEEEEAPITGVEWDWPSGVEWHGPPHGVIGVRSPEAGSAQCQPERTS